MFKHLADNYLESQAENHNTARSFTSHDVVDRYVSGQFSPQCETDASRLLHRSVNDTEVKTHAAAPGSNVCFRRDAVHTERNLSLEERHCGSGRSEPDASRSMSCPEGVTAVKTCNTTSNSDSCFGRDNRQSDNRELGIQGSVVEQNGTAVPPSSSSIPVTARDEASSNRSTISEVECVPAEETDGPEPEMLSLQRSPVPETDGPEPNVSLRSSRPVAVLSPTSASSANDSGYVEQDGTLSPLSRLVESTRLSCKPPHGHSEPVTLRNYQKELSEPGCLGSNCIICAPTGSGKTFTAGYICKTRRNNAVAEHQRFKCLFVVCIRNLIAQQRDALCRIMPESGIVCGMDDKLMLSEYFQQFDVVVATAQVCTSQSVLNTDKFTAVFLNKLQVAARIPLLSTCVSEFTLTF